MVIKGMTSTCVHVFVVLIIALVVILLCATSTTGYHISLEKPESVYSNINSFDSTVTREKRQTESFDDDDLGVFAQQEQEPDQGFWDKVVKAALKLFSRFVEWLNSS